MTYWRFESIPAARDIFPLSRWNRCATLDVAVNDASREEIFPAAAHKTKRRRGAQKGNQNARRHGFYSRSLGPAETDEFWDTINREGLDPELAVLRLKIRSLLQHDPANRRALGEAAGVLTKWLCARYRLDRAGSSCLKRFVRGVLEHRLQDQSSSAQVVAGPGRMSLDQFQ